MLFQYDIFFSFSVWFPASFIRQHKTIPKSIQGSEIQILNGTYGGSVLSRNAELQKYARDFSYGLFQGISGRRSDAANKRLKLMYSDIFLFSKVKL